MEGRRKLDVRPKEKLRSYFCKPCGYKHSCPTNAKCPRQRQKQATSLSESLHEDQPSTSNAATRGRARPVPETPLKEASGKRKRQVILYDSESERDEPSPVRRRTSSGPDEVSLNSIMEHLEAISDEGRKERECLANENKADREYFRSALSALQQVSSSDDSERVQSGRQTRSGGVTSDMERPDLGGLPTGRDALSVLRQDNPTARAANDVLQRCGPMQDDVTNKKTEKWV